LPVKKDDFLNEEHGMLFDKRELMGNIYQSARFSKKIIALSFMHFLKKEGISKWTQQK
jgi:hypothetical protein